MSNLKRVALATLMYLQDYDERLPPMRSAAATQTAIYPYVKNRKVFVCPATSKPYVPNAAVGNKLLAKIPKPVTTMIWRDAKPHADGMWTVAYLDGHVKREKKLPASVTKKSSGGHKKSRGGKHKSKK